MPSVRRTISLPPAVAERLQREAKRRKTSFSALIAELLQQQPEHLPYAGTMRIFPSGWRKCSPESTVDHLRYGPSCLGDQPRRASAASLRRRAVGPPRAEGCRPVARSCRSGFVAARTGVPSGCAYICAKSQGRHTSSRNPECVRVRTRPRSRAAILGQWCGSPRSHCGGHGLTPTSPHPDLGLPAFPRGSAATRPSLAFGCGGKRAARPLARWPPLLS